MVYVRHSIVMRNYRGEPLLEVYVGRTCSYIYQFHLCMYASVSSLRQLTDNLYIITSLSSVRMLTWCVGGGWTSEIVM